MTRRIWLVLAVAAAVLGLAAAGCGGDDGGGDEVTVSLEELNGSGQSGTATLTADGEQTRVVIAIDGPVSPSQPAHIHEGTCAELTPEPAFGFPNVEDGNLDTTVDVSLEELTSGEYAINLHQSNEDLATYTSCGNI